MSYQPNEWLDHIVDPEYEEIIQQGTPVTAKRMNHIEQGIAEVHDIAESTKSMAMSTAVEVAILRGATFSGVTSNVFVETLEDTEDVVITNGVYDPTNKRVYLP